MYEAIKDTGFRVAWFSLHTGIRVMDKTLHDPRFTVHS